MEDGGSSGRGGEEVTGVDLKGQVGGGGACRALPRHAGGAVGEATSDIQLNTEKCAKAVRCGRYLGEEVLEGAGQVEVAIEQGEEELRGKAEDVEGGSVRLHEPP